MATGKGLQSLTRDQVALLSLLQNPPVAHLDLRNSLRMIRGAGSITFGRDSTGTYIDRYGVLQTAAIDEPRFEANGLLMEGASTNYLQYSQDLNLAPWSTLNSSITPNPINGLDGTLTADKLVDDATNNAHYIIQSFSFTADEDVTLSVFAKAAEHDKIQLRMGSGAFGGVDAPFATFDLTLGVIISSGGPLSKARIEPKKDGWFRLSLSATATTTLPANAVIYLYTDSVVFVGNGTDGAYLWGAQMEKLSFPTSYIPTTTTAIPREGEYCVIDYDGNFPAFDESFTVVSSFNTFGDKSGTSQRPWMIGGATNILVQENTGATDWNFYSGSGSPVSTGSIVGYDIQTQHRIGTRVDVDLAKAYMFSDGKYVNEVDWSVATGTANGLIGIGGGISAGAQALYGHISDIKFFDRALTDAEMRLV